MISPDGTEFFTANEDGKVYAVSNVTGLLTGTLVGPGNPMRSVAVHPTQPMVAGGEGTTGVTVWNRTNGAVIKQINGIGYVLCLDFSKTGDRLAIGTEDGLVHIFETTTWTEIKSLGGQKGQLVAASKSGKVLVTGDGVSVIRVRNSHTGQVVRQWQAHNSSGSGIYQLAVSNDGVYTASLGYAGDLKVWRTSDGTHVWSKTISTLQYTSIAISPDGTEICVAGKPIELYDLATGALKATVSGPLETATNLAYSPNGGTLYWTGTDEFLGVKTFKAVRLSDGQVLWNNPHVYSVPAKKLSISADGTRIALWQEFGGPDFVVVYSTASGNVVTTLTPNAPNTDSPGGILFSQDGKQVMVSRSSSTNGSVASVYDVASGARLLHWQDMDSTFHEAVSLGKLGLIVWANGDAVRAIRDPMFLTQAKPFVAFADSVSLNWAFHHGREDTKSNLCPADSGRRHLRPLCLLACTQL